MSWEKVGVTVVGKPVLHGSGIYVRISKKVAEAYGLFTAMAIEVTVNRVKRPLKEETSQEEESG